MPRAHNAGITFKFAAVSLEYIFMNSLDLGLAHSRVHGLHNFPLTHGRNLYRFCKQFQFFFRFYLPQFGHVKI